VAFRSRHGPFDKFKIFISNGPLLRADRHREPGPVAFRSAAMIVNPPAFHPAWMMLGRLARGGIDAMATSDRG
jgi:hypothetical protein